MQIFVDADACPVVDIIEKIAKKYGIPVMLLCDTNHILNSEYSEVKIIGAGADAVDYALIRLCRKGDIVVSQDYGVAAMALGKGAYAIHQSGKWYTDENIDQMLMERHLAKKARRASGKNHLKGPKKRSAEDDERFTESFEKMIKKALTEDGNEKNSGVFTGTGDPWVGKENSRIPELCQEHKIPCYMYPEANHSLETGNVQTDLDNMRQIMEKTKEFMKRFQFIRKIEVNEET